MLRPLAVSIALALPALSLAQSAEGQSAEPSKRGYSSTVEGSWPASPPQTQDRVFAGSRVWLLDPGRYEVEVWLDDQEKSPPDRLLQAEIEIGLAPHLQLDLYQNLTLDHGVSSEGQQLEARYAFGNAWNAIPANPVLYLEFHPRHLAADRAEARLLLGGEAGARGLWAANLFLEQNVDGFDVPGSEGADRELGATGALSFEVAPWLRAGAEVKGGLDQHGAAAAYPMLLAGPNLLVKAFPFKLTVTAFFGVFQHDPPLHLLAIAGWQW